MLRRMLKQWARYRRSCMLPGKCPSIVKNTTTQWSCGRPFRSWESGPPGSQMSWRWPRIIQSVSLEMAARNYGHIYLCILISNLQCWNTKGWTQVANRNGWHLHVIQNQRELFCLMSRARHAFLQLRVKVIKMACLWFICLIYFQGTFLLFLQMPDPRRSLSRPWEGMSLTEWWWWLKSISSGTKIVQKKRNIHYPWSSKTFFNPF